MQTGRGPSPKTSWLNSELSFVQKIPYLIAPFPSQKALSSTTQGSFFNLQQFTQPWNRTS